MKSEDKILNILDGIFCVAASGLVLLAANEAVENGYLDQFQQAAEDIQKHGREGGRGVPEKFMPLIDKATEFLDGRMPSHKPFRRPHRPSHQPECTGKDFKFGDWVFTLPQPNC